MSGPLQITMMKLFFLLSIIAYSTATSCQEGKNALELARTKWTNSKPPSCYTYTLTTSQLGPVEPKSISVQANNGASSNGMSVEQLFQLIQTECYNECETANTAARCTIQFAAREGYPLQILIDYSSTRVGEELRYKVTEFQENACSSAKNPTKAESGGRGTISRSEMGEGQHSSATRYVQ